MADEATAGVVKESSRSSSWSGSSPRSFSDAARNAVKVASQTVRHIRGVEVLSSTAEVDEDGELTTYKAHCKTPFLVEQSMDEQKHSRGPSAAVAASAAGAVLIRVRTSPPAGITTDPTWEDR